MATDKNNKFQLNKSSNKEFDINKGSKRKFDLTKDEGEEVIVTGAKPNKTTPAKQTKAQEELKNSEIATARETTSVNNNSQQSTEAPKGNKKWLWILLLIAVLTLAWWLMSRNDDSAKPGNITPESNITEQADPSNEGQISDSDTTSAAPCQTEIDNEPKEAGDDQDKVNQEPSVTTPAQPSSPVATTPDTKTKLTTTANISNDIEAEARKVIRGDYGCYPERKEALGSKYSEVQARVNQLMNEE